jgi:CRP-like cAMP-binding protein
VLAAIALGALVTPPIITALGLDGALVVMAFAPLGLGLLGLPALAALDRDAAARLATLAPRIAALEGVGIFAGASRAVLERLAAAATEVTVAAGEPVVREGEQADALYVVVDGEVEVTAVGEGAAERPLRTLGPGSYFGEIGLLERIPRTATVTALREARCYRIDGDTFLDALTATPPAAAFVETARAGLARTHPSLRPTYEPAAV